MSSSTPSPHPSSSPRARPARHAPVPFAVVMAVLIGAATFPQSAFFTVRRIDVSGIVTLPPKTVIALAGVQHGDRLFAVDAAGVARRLRAHPRIKDAQVRVRPPQTLAIMVTERTPVLALGVGDRLALIDDEGVVVDLTDSPAGLVMVADRTGRPVGARRGTPAESEAVGVALKTLPAIPAELRGRVVEVVVDAGSDVTLVMRSGLRIRVGALAGLTQRLEQVPGVLDAMSARGVTVAVIDLRYAGSIVVRPHAGGDGK